MVKSTVRFPEDIVEEIDALVADGHFESKSEFYRFATDLVLDQLADEYEPATIDFLELKKALFETSPVVIDSVAPEPNDELVRAAAHVRRYGMRGDFAAAEAFIDDHYAPAERECLLLEELLELYRRRGPARTSP